MRRELYFTFLSLIFLIYSCQKDKTNNQETNQIPQELTQDNYHTFAKSLAKVIDNKEIKAALKTKALEKFDGDYDVLVKDFVLIKLKDGKSILDLLAKQNEEVRSIIANNPLLTIYVPELKIFSANNWDTEKTTPIVAVRNNNGSNKIYAYNTRLNIVELDKKIEPTNPTILVKTNERLPLINDESTQVIIAKSFDSTSSVNKAASVNNRASSNRNWRVLDPLAPKVLEAINKNIPLSNIRDYVYYGLNPNENINESKLTGYDYAEHIISIQLTDELVLNKIADWGEGDLEIKITVNIPQQNGTPLQINKVIFCTKDELYQPPSGRTAGYLKPFVGFDPIQIATWDNYNLGNMWTFHAEEFDEGEERTTTETIENTFTKEGGGSFEVTLNEIFKIGLSGKASKVERKTSTFTMKSTNNSDNMYDAILNYLEPVAQLEKVGRDSYQYRPYYLNTGAIKIRVEPYPTGGL
jgi:hypothetical protein